MHSQFYAPIESFRKCLSSPTGRGKNQSILLFIIPRSYSADRPLLLYGRFGPEFCPRSNSNVRHVRNANEAYVKRGSRIEKGRKQWRIYSKHFLNYACPTWRHCRLGDNAVPRWSRFIKSQESVHSDGASVLKAFYYINNGVMSF
jgi:hypothetical protein